jgi:hypothetical protein
MSSIKLKGAIAAAAAALVLGGAALGIAGAQQTPTPTPGGQSGPHSQRHEQFLSTLAAKLGVSTDRLKQAFTETRSDLGLPDRRAGAIGGRPGGPMFGPAFGVAANAMNLSVDQLRQELPSHSLTQVAQTHNVDPKVVADTLKAEAIARVDRGVSAGWLTTERADQIKQGIGARIDQLMTHQFPAAGQTGGWSPADRPAARFHDGGPRPGWSPSVGPRL